MIDPNILLVCSLFGGLISGVIVCVLVKRGPRGRDGAAGPTGPTGPAGCDAEPQVAPGVQMYCSTSHRAPQAANDGAKMEYGKTFMEPKSSFEVHRPAKVPHDEASWEAFRNAAGNMALRLSVAETNDKATIRLLQERVTRQNTEIEALRKGRKNSGETIGLLQESIARRDKELTGLQNTVDRQEAEIEALRKNKESGEASIKLLRQSEDRKIVTIEELSAERERLTARVNDLSQQCHSLRAGEVAGARSRIADLQYVLREAHKRNRTLVKRCEHLELELVETRTSCNTLSGVCAELRTKIQQLQNEPLALEHDRISQICADLRSNNEELKRRVSCQIEDRRLLEKELARLKAEQDMSIKDAQIALRVACEEITRLKGHA